MRNRKRRSGVQIFSWNTHGYQRYVHTILEFGRGNLLDKRKHTAAEASTKWIGYAARFLEKSSRMMLGNSEKWKALFARYVRDINKNYLFRLAALLCEQFLLIFLLLSFPQQEKLSLICTTFVEPKIRRRKLRFSSSYFTRVSTIMLFDCRSFLLPHEPNTGSSEASQFSQIFCFVASHRSHTCENFHC